MDSITEFMNLITAFISTFVELFLSYILAIWEALLCTEGECYL